MKNMKVHVKRAFKNCFLSPKKLKKQQTLHEVFFNLQYKCAEVPIFPISKLISRFSATPLFQRRFQPSGQDQQNGKQKHCRLPP